MRNNTVYCVPGNGVMYFYLKAKDGDHYLCGKPYNHRVRKMFENGISVDEIFSKRSHAYDSVFWNIFDDLPKHIKYIEKEYDLQITKKSKNRNRCRC